MILGVGQGFPIVKLKDFSIWPIADGEPEEGHMSQRNRQQNSGSNDSGVFQVKHVLIAAAIVAFVFLAIRVRKTQMVQAAKPEVEEKIDSAPVLLDNKATDNFNKDAYERELIQYRKKVHNIRALGLKSLTLTKVKGKVSIPFEFVPKKVWCQGGDIDTIRYATSKTSAKEVLIALETMGSNKVSETLRVSVDNLVAGFEHTFLLDGGVGDKSLSLSICTDRKKTNSCKKANVIDQNTLNNTLGANFNQTDKDYLFYFQHLIYNGESVQTYRSDMFHSDFKKKLSGFLEKADVDKDESDRAWKLNRTIKSNPVDIVKGKIVLSLPYNDPRCMPSN